MGTPASICVRLGDKVQLLEVCCDGNYEQAGRVLVEHYKTLDAVKSLFLLGGVISSVKPKLQDINSHSVHWDRQVRVQVFTPEHLMVFKDCMDEYTYIFNGDAYLADYPNGAPEFDVDDYSYWQVLRHGEIVSLEYILENL